MVAYLVAVPNDGPAMLLATGLDYLSFMALLGSLFAISGAAYLVRGTR